MQLKHKWGMTYIISVLGLVSLDLNGTTLVFLLVMATSTMVLDQLNNKTGVKK